LWDPSAVRSGRTLLPLGDSLGIILVAPGQRSPALDYFVSSTDCLCRCGAAMKNLSHGASFHLENNAPSNPGIEHLVKDREPPKLIKLLTRLADEVPAGGDWRQRRNPALAPKWLPAFDSPRVSSEELTSYGP